jgi:protein-S-isoprenylcysteine O-methyltransferase Ste14
MPLCREFEVFYSVENAQADGDGTAELSAKPKAFNLMRHTAAHPATEAVPRRLSHRVFSHRLPVGLIFVAIGAMVARPHTLWGEYQLWGWLASLAMVFAGMGLRFWAAGSAGNHTHSAEIEGPRLSTGGPYAFTRNPIYLGSMVLGLGMIGLIGDARLLPLYVVAFALLYAILIPAEERFLREKFRTEFEEYCAAVPRIIPRFTAWKNRAERAFHWGAARGELRLLGVLVGIYGVLELGAWVREE